MRYLLTILFIFGAGLANAQALQKTVGIGDTDVSVTIRIVDSSDGTPETGVEHNTSGIDLEYRREGAATTDITEAALSALTDAHSDGGIEHIGNGYYRLDVPDAAFATGADSVLIHGTVPDMVVIGCTIQITQTLTVDSNGRAKTDVESISGSTAPADNLETAFGNTLAEVSGVPAATDPLWEKVGFLFQALTAGYENTTSNGGEKRYKNAAGTVQWEKDLTDNGTTYTESAAGTPD